MTLAWKPSVTVAAVVERGGRFLLVEEQTEGGIRINQPAGHLDPGETLADAVVRETLEETAHQFTPRALVGVYMARSESSDVTYLRFAFAGELGKHDAGRALDHGIVRTLWLTASEIRTRMSDHRSALVMKGVEDYLAGRRFPLDLVYTHGSAIGRP